MTISGLMMVAAGTVLFLWYRTLAGLPLRQRPRFIRPATFKWGVPAVALILFAEGVVLLVQGSAAVASWAVVAAATFCGLVIRFDKYSAGMRLIYDHYLEVRRANPTMEEAELLFHTARWRYPEWTHDRLVELVAGKNIEALCLLMILTENGINPIQDWELYRSLKRKAKRIIRSGKQNTVEAS